MLNIVYNKYLAVFTGVVERINEFKNCEKGVTAVEYAIVIAGVAAVVSTIFATDGIVSDMLTNIFDGIETKVTTLIDNN